MEATEALRLLFGVAGESELVEFRLIPSLGAPSTYVAVPDLAVPAQPVGCSQFFNVMALDGEHKPTYGTLVWVDCDDKAGDTPDPSKVRPTPTLGVSSGGGVHVYWVLSSAVPPTHARRLSMLATMGLSGDRHAVNSVHRVMRVPGSVNYKYDPPRPVGVVHQSPLTWEADELEEALVAMLAGPYWEKGDRHALALALAATLARAGWDEDRAERTMLLICDVTGDTERVDRKLAGRHTVTRYKEGKYVSSAAWREALGEVDFKYFLSALGITAREGELVRGGEVIGHTEHLEEALVDGFLAEGDWSWDGGKPVKWVGPHWAARDESVVKSAVFDWMRTVTQVKEGEERPLVASAKLSGAVASIVVGKLQDTPLDPPRPGWVAVLNGALHLETRSLREARRDDNFRYSLRAAYDPEATCPSWLWYLNQSFTGTEAPEIIAFLQEHAGYLLYPGNPWQVFLWLYGKQGTGKSTFIDNVAWLMGEGAIAVKSHKFDDYTIASLAGRALATCDELPPRQLGTSTLKALTSSDPVQARHPYGRPFTVVFDGKLHMGSNNQPPVDEGEGLWRRMKLIEFLNAILSKDVNLDERIQAEASGLLNWILDGHDRVVAYTKASHWPEPKSVTAKVAEYRKAADTFAAFAAEEIELGTDFACTTRELYTRYAGWAREHGHRVEPLGPVFQRELRGLGLAMAAEPTIVEGRPVMLWHGGKLRPEVFNGNLP